MSGNELDVIKPFNIFSRLCSKFHFGHFMVLQVVHSTQVCVSYYSSLTILVTQNENSGSMKEAFRPLSLGY